MSMTLLQAHTIVADAHGDRAWANSTFVPVVGDVVSKARTADKANDEGRAPLTLRDDDSLTMAVAADARYALDSFLVVAGDPAAGMTLTFTAPSGSTGAWAPVAPQDSGGTGNVRTAALPYGTPVAVGVSDQGVIVPPRGTLTTGTTPGFLTLQWAPTTTPATALTLRAGSWLRLTRMG